jgi:hypothetical protein
MSWKSDRYPSIKAGDSKLTPACRKSSLAIYGELSINQCAEIMGKSEAIKALQHSAVLALRRVLAGDEL